MRVFDRRVNQALVINEDVCVTVLEVQEEFVRIGIRCAGHEPAYREEVLFVPTTQDATLEIASL